MLQVELPEYSNVRKKLCVVWGLTEATPLKVGFSLFVAVCSVRGSSVWFMHLNDSLSCEGL